MATNGWAAIYNNNMFRKYRPNVFTKNGEWKPCRAFVFTEGQWKMAGQTQHLMIPFIDSDELFLETYDSEWLLVPFIENDTL